jgi:hypothetical protein
MRWRELGCHLQSHLCVLICPDNHHVAAFFACRRQDRNGDREAERSRSRFDEPMRLAGYGDASREVLT